MYIYIHIYRIGLSLFNHLCFNGCNLLTDINLDQGNHN